MPSAKGKPTDPKLKEKVTEGNYPYLYRIVALPTCPTEVKQQTNKDGSGKGQMAAWKVLLSLFKTLSSLVEQSQAAKIGKEYEARGGDYENEPGSKDKPEKGPPQKKSEAQRKSEVEVSSSKTSSNEGYFADNEKMDAKNEEDSDSEPKAKGKGKGAVKIKGGEKKDVKEKSASKEKKEPKEGERKSSRQAGKKAEEHELPGRERKTAEARTKRKSQDEKGEGEGEGEAEQKPVAKKGKVVSGKAKK